MYNISFNISVQCDSLNLILALQTTVRVLPVERIPAQDSEPPRRVPVAALHRGSVLYNLSHLTEDDGEIYVNTGVVELHNSLWYQIFLNSLQLRLLSAIFCHHRLFIEFMGKVTILVIVQRTPPRENKRCCVPGAFETGQRLLVPIAG